MNRILVIEDDDAIQRLLGISLKEEGFEAVKASDGKEGINLASSQPFSLILLDLGLPDIDGKEVIEALRVISNNIPIIVVSARSDSEEKIACLDLGVNDYVQKPFSVGELMARIRASIRNRKKDEPASPVFVNGDLKIDFDAHKVYSKGKEIHLTKIEYDILKLLADNIGKTLTHNFIITHVWGPDGIDSNGLRVFMAGLRRKLLDDPYEDPLIETYVGIGYGMNKIS